MKLYYFEEQWAMKIIHLYKTHNAKKKSEVSIIEAWFKNLNHDQVNAIQ